MAKSKDYACRAWPFQPFDMIINISEIRPGFDSKYVFLG